ncbi:MAG: DUF3887 domain-containing protein [Dokdonella sp.]|uniref:DUF3887 domain-containing protein n=1 Tax=Dokdonella sp. TaxID=2291710 RepID=UPI003267B2AB
MPIRSFAFAVLLVASAAQAATKPKSKPAPAVEQAPVENIDVDAMARAKDADASVPADPSVAMPPSTPAAEEPSAVEQAPPALPAQASEAAVPPLLAPAPDDAERRLGAACEARAKSLLDSAQKGDYATATHDFDAKMRTALPEPKFKKAWESLAQFGALTARGQSHIAKGQDYLAVTVPLIFEKANLYAQVACGSDGRIAGFYVKPLDLPKQ